jgi:hypothetical protein
MYSGARKGQAVPALLVKAIEICRHHDLVYRYGISVYQMATDMFVCRNHNPCPVLIHDLSPDVLLVYNIGRSCEDGRTYIYTIFIILINQHSDVFEVFSDSSRETIFLS